MHTRHNDVLRHPTIHGFAAPGYLWSAVGAGISSNTDTVTLSGLRPGDDQIIALAWAKHQDSTAALVWAAEEIVRRKEVSDACRTSNREASALEQLAKGLRADTERLLAKLPPRLRQRVQELASR